MDEQQLYNLALKTKDIESAREAISKIKDQKLLVNIAKKTLLDKIGILAVESITGDDHLFEVAKGLGTIPAVSMAAINKIRDIKYLNKLSGSSSIFLPGKYIINDKISDLAVQSNKIDSYKSAYSYLYSGIACFVISIVLGVIVVKAGITDSIVLSILSVVSFVTFIYLLIKYKKVRTNYVLFSDKEIKVMNGNNPIQSYPYSSLNIDFDIPKKDDPLNTEILVPYNFNCQDTLSGKELNFLNVFKSYGIYSVAKQAHYRHPFLPEKIRIVLVRSFSEENQYENKTTYLFQDGFYDYRNTVNWNPEVDPNSSDFSFYYKYDDENGFSLKYNGTDLAWCYSHPIRDIQEISGSDLSLPFQSKDYPKSIKLDKEINIHLEKWEALVINMSISGIMYYGILIPFTNILSSHPDNFLN